MSNAHHLLAAAWEAGDTTPLLVLADLLDERADPDTAELLRLVAADARTARHDPARGRRLRQLQDGIWKRIKSTAWPDLAVQGAGGAASFGRRPDPSRPDRQCVVARPDRRTVHWLVVALDRNDEVVRTGGGQELLRRPLPAASLAAVRRGEYFYARPGFTLVHDFFPTPPGTADLAASLVERERRFEAAVEPARLPVRDLPTELVPFVAWSLAEYLADRPRRVRAGEPVPGAHLFLFRDGHWHHAASLDPGDFGRAAELLRRRFRRERDRGVTAGLLVRVADGGRITARKLVWVGPDRGGRETHNLRAATDTLGAEAFRQAAADLGADITTFVRDTGARLRDLFTAAPPTA